MNKELFFGSKYHEEDNIPYSIREYETISKPIVENFDDVGYTSIIPLGQGIYFIQTENEYNFCKAKKVRYKYKHNDEVKTKTTKEYYLPWNNSYIKITSPLLEKHILNKLNLDNLISEYNNRKNELPKLREVYKEIVTLSKILFDLRTNKDYHLLALFILQSYLKPALSNVFFLHIEGDKHSGKSTLLNFISTISYNSFKCQDVSGAFISRLVETYSANICVDELDELGKKKDDVMNILRSGYTKDMVGAGKLEKINNQFVPKAFSSYGSHCYTLRSDSEDALKSRSYSIYSKNTDDDRLARLNKELVTLCNKIVTELNLILLHNFRLWVMHFQQNVTSVTGFSRNYEITKVLDIEKSRQDLYNFLTKSYTPEQKIIMKQIKSRNSQLADTLFTLLQMIGIEEDDFVKEIIESKIADDDANVDIEQDIVKTALINLYQMHHNDIQQYNNNFFVTINQFNLEVNRLSKEYNLQLSQRVMKKYALHYNFVNGVTYGKQARVNYIHFILKNNEEVKTEKHGVQRILIYTDEIKSRLGLSNE